MVDSKKPFSGIIEEQARKVAAAKVPFAEAVKTLPNVSLIINKEPAEYHTSMDCGALWVNDFNMYYTATNDTVFRDDFKQSSYRKARTKIEDKHCPDFKFLPETYDFVQSKELAVFEWSPDMLAEIKKVLGKEPHKSNLKKVGELLLVLNQERQTLDILLKGLQDLSDKRFATDRSIDYFEHKSYRGEVLVRGGVGDEPQTFEVDTPVGRRQVSFDEFEKRVLKSIVEKNLLNRSAAFSACNNLVDVEKKILERSDNNPFWQQHTENIKTILHDNLPEWLKKIVAKQEELLDI